MSTYRIVRFFEEPGKVKKIIRRGLTREQAMEWCKDPETSSMTAQRACHNSEKLIEQWHKEQKHWFDGFEEEK